MAYFCGLGGLCGNVLPAAEELTKEEVAGLFSISTRLNQGRLIVHGLFARADTKNTNGRIYPKAIMKREVSRFKRQHIKQGTALGELNHPSYYSSYFRSLNLPNVSHQVLDVWWRGRELWGTIEVLPTPAGLLLWELYSKGIKLGVSSRGWASVVVDPSTQQMFVDKDFQLITFDFVTEPSNAGAFLVPISRRYRRRVPDQSRIVRVSYLGIGSSHMAQLTQIPGATALSSWLKQTSKAMSAALQPLATAQPQQSLLLDTSANGTVPMLSQPPTAAVAVACSAQPNGEDTASPVGSQQGFKRTVSGAGSTSEAPAGSLLAVLGSRSLSGTATLPPYTSLGGGVVLGCHYQVLDEPWLPVDPAGREFKMHLSLVATKAHLLQQKQERRRQRKQQKQGRLQEQPLSEQPPNQQEQELVADSKAGSGPAAGVGLKQKQHSVRVADQSKQLQADLPAGQLPQQQMQVDAVQQPLAQTAVGGSVYELEQGQQLPELPTALFSSGVALFAGNSAAAADALQDQQTYNVLQQTQPGQPNSSSISQQIDSQQMQQSAPQIQALRQRASSRTRVAPLQEQPEVQQQDGQQIQQQQAWKQQYVQSWVSSGQGLTGDNGQAVARIDSEHDRGDDKGSPTAVLTAEQACRPVDRKTSAGLHVLTAAQEQQQQAQLDRSNGGSDHSTSQIAAWYADDPDLGIVASKATDRVTGDGTARKQAVFVSSG